LDLARRARAVKSGILDEHQRPLVAEFRSRFKSKRKVHLNSNRKSSNAILKLPPSPIDFNFIFHVNFWYAAFEEQHQVKLPLQ
jgi:hypothetical protein